MTTQDSTAQPARELLCDSFERVRQLVTGTTEGLSPRAPTYRVDADANTIGWLVWHLSRVQDDHIADAAGADQVWTSTGWYERFALPFDAAATGYGQDSDEVAAVNVAPDLLDGYHRDVHGRTIEYVESLSHDELARVLDDSWDPPVTVSARLVSVLGDCMQHLGQVAYVRGLAERAERQHRMTSDSD